ncbi:MerR family transcriptional regulator [Luteipulveratus sp. YIM 133132]|uniref:DNA polymerase III subunit beta family protein n=1 Tax=Luteipulveratus flavus TaxID=3031728 RepID=UPI0023AF1B4C|nr:MerR family transcriptional regulator [Luteipulveratus sp. YIM 133132]MDE9364910.1 MerR family transcriptional regulator [Luteipulveratus sp. YIM 133132]
MTDPEPLLTISSFARLVGLSPSALRFYDDCDLLRPVEVDARSGYRYYAAAQEHRAVLIRRLREIDVPLPQVRLVLDGQREEAHRALEAHVAATQGRARRAGEVVADLVAALTVEGDGAGGVADGDRGAAGGPTTVSLGGPELASAIRQVAPAAAQVPDVPALTGVLLDITGAELVVIATDRYWLAMRTLPTHAVDGPDRRVLVPVDELSALAAWVARHDRVVLRATSAGLTVAPADGAADVRDVPLLVDEFPSYRVIFERVDTPRQRVIVDRVTLQRTVLATGATGAVVLAADGAALTVRAEGDEEGVRLDAVCTGSPEPIAFRPSLLAAALETSVGPDVLLEVIASDRPVVVRSADQGTFTTLVMPVRMTAPVPG